MADPFGVPTTELSQLMVFFHHIKTHPDWSQVELTLRQALQYRSSCGNFCEILRGYMTHVVNTVPRAGTGGDLGLDCRYIEGQLRQGRVVQIEWRGGGGDHEFNIVPQGDGSARVLHTNVGVHQPRYEASRSINDIMADLRTSTTTTGRDCIDATQRLVRMEVNGNAPMKVRGVVTGTPARTFLDSAGNPNSYYNAARDRFLASMEQLEREYLANVRALQMQLGIGTAVSAVISLGLAIVSECRDNTKGRTTADIAENISVKTVIGGTGGLTGVAVSRLCRGTFDSTSLFRAGGAVSAMISGLSLAHDATLRARGKITSVEQRKRMASNLAGSAGGLIGGAGVPALCLVLASNPVGWAVVLGGIAGGVVGGVLGGIGGAKLDEVLWDETEDNVQHVYEFFYLETKRGETPKVHDEAVVTRHFEAKMKEHPDDSEWIDYCQQMGMNLVRCMFKVEMAAFVKLSVKLASEPIAHPGACTPPFVRTLLRASFALLCGMLLYFILFY